MESISSDIQKSDKIRISELLKRRHFFPFARQLDIEDNVVEQIMVKCDTLRLGDQEIPMEILNEWKMRQGTNATTSWLIRALQNIGCDGIVHKIFSIPFSPVSDSRIEEIKEAIVKRQKRTYLDVELPQIPGMEKILPLDELYVNLQIEKVQGKHETFHDGRIELEDLFDAINEQEPKRILVEGPPGMGKSTLCAKLIYDWASDKQYLISKFKLVFLFELRYMHHNDSIRTLLIEESEEEGFSPDEIMNCIKNYEKEILVILDGFDEMTEKGKKNLFTLLQKKVFQSMTVIVTSRNGMVEWKNRTDKSPAGKVKQHDKFLNPLHCFDKRIQVTGINQNDIEEFLKKYFGNEVDNLNATIHSISKGGLNEICQCPLFLLLLAILVEDGPLQNVQSMTSLYKEFFNFIIKRSLIREKMLKADEEFEIFSSSKTEHSFKHTCIQLLKNFGLFVLSKLMKGILIFEEDDILRACGNEKLILKLGFLIKTSKIKRRQKKTFYEPIHKSFIEFLAAFTKFNEINELGEDVFKREIEDISNGGLLPTNDSLFYVFLGGFLNSKAFVLFSALLAHSYWFHLENICFTKILSEIEDISSFMNSFEDIMPSFIPSFYSVGDSYSISSEFYSSPIHSLILNKSFSLQLIRLFQWDPSYAINLNPLQFTINHLIINYSDNLCEEHFLRGENSFVCRHLSLQFSEAFDVDHWSNIIKAIEPIRTEKLNIVVNELNDDDLIDSLLLSIHKELSTGQWMKKTIDRLKLKLNCKNLSNCSPFLFDLVKMNKIKEGVYLEIVGDARRTEFEMNEIKISLESLFHLIINSKSITNIYVYNWNSRLLPVFDFNDLSKKTNTRWKSFYFKGYLILLNENRSEKINVEEATIASNFNWNEENNSLFIQNLRGMKYLRCRQECFNSLTTMDLQNLKEIEELYLKDVRENYQWNHYSSHFIHLQVLTLGFSTYFQFSPMENAFAQLLSLLNLRIFEIIEINGIPLFDSLIQCINEGLNLKKNSSINSMITSTEKDFPLEELCISFYDKFDFRNLNSNTVGINGIQQLLQMSQMERCCWFDKYSSCDARANLSSLFHFSDGFQIKVEVDGMDPRASRRSQIDYRLLLIYYKYCISMRDFVAS